MCHQLLRKHVDKCALSVVNTFIVEEQHARVRRHPSDLKTTQIPIGSHVKFLKLCASVLISVYVLIFKNKKKCPTVSGSPI